MLIEGGSHDICKATECDYDRYAETVTELSSEVIAVRLSDITELFPSVTPLIIPADVGKYSLTMFPIQIDYLKAAMRESFDEKVRVNVVSKCPITPKNDEASDCTNVRPSLAMRILGLATAAAAAAFALP